MHGIFTNLLYINILVKCRQVLDAGGTEASRRNLPTLSVVRCTLTRLEGGESRDFVEEIGNEIEDPFGVDPNDLPVDGICQTVLDNIYELTATTGAEEAEVKLALDVG